MNQLYPIFLKLDGRPCLVVGGGTVGERKVESLLEAGARVTVVSPELSEGLARRAAEGRVRWVSRRYQPGDLAGMCLVFSGVGDRQVSAAVHEEAGRRGIPVNAVDHDPHCTFHVPAMVVRGDLKIAISTGGKSPALASELKARIASAIDEDLVRFLAALGALRPRVLERYPLERRGKILKALARSIRPAGVAPGGPAPGPVGPGRAERGKVYLVGAGPGDPGLLTLRGLELIRTADEVHHDRLVGPGVLALVPSEVRRIFVGKEVGHDRPDTGEMLVRAARAGKAVVRLKGGDPNVFGRGGEEMLALLKAGVPFEVVPGVSALTAAPAAAGIPITFRGLAREVVVRSGYHRPDPHLPAAAAPPLETTYVYFMTIGRLAEIVDELLAEGLDPATPAAIVQRGTLPGQRVLIATLESLAARAGEDDLKAPAMVIVGEVVRIACWKENADLLEACLLGGTARADD
jgi:uroporphyrin-III C-methyltransferase / precorrin-2 dehydrogenase / sirohydrochlorin ferrochelatase